MKGFQFVIIAITLGLLIGFPGSLVSTAAGQDPIETPNVIIMMADDMGICDTSAYQDWTQNKDDEQVETPAMERLAKTGIRFTESMTPR